MLPMSSMLLKSATGSWWLVVLRGVLAVIFGILALVVPGITLFVLVLWWGAYATADGILSLITAFRWRDSGKPLWTLLLMGVLGIAAGMVAFISPKITAVVLLMFIAAWAIAIGILQIITAIRIRKEVKNEWLLALSGIVSLIFGLLMFARPAAGALAVVWIIGLDAIFFGILLVGAGFRLKSHAREEAVAQAS